MSSLEPSQGFSGVLLASAAFAVLFGAFELLPYGVALYQYVFDHAPLLTIALPLLLWPIPLALFVLAEVLQSRERSDRVRRALFFFMLVVTSAACLAGLYAVVGSPPVHLLLPLMSACYLIYILRLWHQNTLDERMVEDGHLSRGGLAVVAVAGTLHFLVLAWYDTSPLILFTVLMSSVPVVSEAVISVRSMLLGYSTGS